MSELPKDPFADEPSLQAELAKYRKAYEEEWERANLVAPGNVGELDTKALREQTQALLLQAVPSAVERIIAIMEHSDKDGVQLSAAKFILDTVLGKNSALKVADDPLDALLAKLAMNDEPGAVETDG